jgi:glycosyltransferase involved in cell wall biosynthesis
MLVSVVIHSWNAADYLREALDSVLAQTFQDFEIIVVDDGSTDHTAEVCARSDRIRYFYQEHDDTEGASAHARAYREARGKYIAGLDHDDRWLPEKLEKQVAALESNLDVAVVFTAVRVIDAAGSEFGPWELEMPEGDVFHALLRGNRFCYSSAMTRRTALDVSGPPDLDAGMGDWDRWLRLSRHFPFMVLKDILTEYRVHPGNYCSDRGKVAQLTRRVLDRYKSRLHPACEECRRSFRAGRRMVSAAYLEDFRLRSKQGQLLRPLPSLFHAISSDPRYALSSKELHLTLGNYGVGMMRRVRGPQTEDAATVSTAAPN